MLLDGFPRTQAQAALLASAGILPNTVVELTLPEADIFERGEADRLGGERDYHVHDSGSILSAAAAVYSKSCKSSGSADRRSRNGAARSAVPNDRRAGLHP